MKKLTCLFLALFLVTAACGCAAGGNNTAGNTSEKGETANETLQTGEEAVTLNTTVHLREEPSVTSGSITQIPKGSEVEWLSITEDGTWSLIRFDGTEGYVLTENLITGNQSPGGEKTEERKKQEEQAPVSDTEPEETASPGESVSSEEPSSEDSARTPYSDPSGGVLSDNGMFDLSGLSNKSIPYGNDWEDKDETGLANGIHYYESVYGKYYPVYRIKTSEKLVYLTMDEGYEAGCTPKILDTLKEKHVHAVFFLTKQFYDSNPELIQRMIDEGHTLGNHTVRHPSGGYPNYVDEHGLDSFTEDLSTLHKLVYDSFGYSMKLFRFPEGESSELLLAKVDNLGYTSVFWSYAHRDYVLDDQPDVSVTLNRCIDHLAPGAVYLLHAVSSSNTEALADFIDEARARGYEFGEFPVDEVTAR